MLKYNPFWQDRQDSGLLTLIYVNTAAIGLGIVVLLAMICNRLDRIVDHLPAAAAPDTRGLKK